MRGAEDVAAVPAVVAALKEREGFLARGRVANEGVRIGFPMGTGGETFDGAERDVVIGGNRSFEGRGFSGGAPARLP